MQRKLSEESHQLQLVLFSQFQFAQQKAVMGWNIMWKQILFLPPNTLHSWQNVNRKVLDFTVELSSYVHTNINLLNWRWRRSKKYFILIETYNETKLNIFVGLNPIVFIEVVIEIFSGMIVCVFDLCGIFCICVKSSRLLSRHPWIKLTECMPPPPLICEASYVHETYIYQHFCRNSFFETN